MVVYFVEQDREVRYIYSRSVSPAQLIVEVQFLQHGAGDKARLVYEPGVETEPRTPPGGAAVPASARDQPAEIFDARPGAELRGLKSLGILVEDLSTRAVACGLNHDAIESALSKRLTDAGVRAHLDNRTETLNYRIRDGETMKVPYMAVIGKREAEADAIALRVRGAGKKQEILPVAEFIARLKAEI